MYSTQGFSSSLPVPPVAALPVPPRGAGTSVIQRSITVIDLTHDDGKSVEAPSLPTAFVPVTIKNRKNRDVAALTHAQSGALTSLSDTRQRPEMLRESEFGPLEKWELPLKRIQEQIDTVNGCIQRGDSIQAISIFKQIIHTLESNPTLGSYSNVDIWTDVVGNLLHNMSYCIEELRKYQPEESDLLLDKFRVIFHEHSHLFTQEIQDKYFSWLGTFSPDPMALNSDDEVVVAALASLRDGLRQGTRSEGGRDNEITSSPESSRDERRQLKRIPSKELQVSLGGYWQEMPDRQTKNSNPKRKRSEMEPQPAQKRAKVESLEGAQGEISLHEDERLNNILFKAYTHIRRGEFREALSEYMIANNNYTLEDFFSIFEIAEIYYNIADCYEKLFTLTSNQEYLKESIAYYELSADFYRRSETPAGKRDANITEKHLGIVRKQLQALA